MIILFKGSTRDFVGFFFALSGSKGLVLGFCYAASIVRLASFSSNIYLVSTALPLQLPYLS